MYKQAILFLLSCLLIVTWSCERDDICSSETPTTPRLIIRLYDITAPEVFKSVSDVRIYGLGKGINNPVVGYETTTTDSIIIPLNTKLDSTSYVFHANYAVNNNGTPENNEDDFVTGNPDTITIRYSREAQYVSRACGFKNIFNNITTNITVDENNWIKVIQPANDNQSVENETAAQLILRH